MFGIGMPEMLLILAIALIVIGPKKIPDLAKSLGRAMREFKKATNDFKETIAIDEDLSDVKKAFDDINTDIKDAVDITAPTKEKPPSVSDVTETQTGESHVETESDDKMEDLKNAFDELNTTTKASAEPESKENEEEDKDSAVASDDQNKKG